MFFRNEFACLSNMYPTPLKINGLCFSCAEAAFQSFKTTDPEIRKKFQFITGPEAKRLGRKVELRPDWNEIRIAVMREVLKCKLKHYPSIYGVIAHAANTPGGVVEENTWNDTFWGVCNGRGENHLGKLLKELYDEDLPF